MSLLLGALAGLYLLVCAGLWLFQERLVFFPGPPPRLRPSDWGFDFEEVQIETPDAERLNAWYLPREAARGVVLVHHGNGGTIEHRVGLAEAFLDCDLSVLLYDYRGYGASTGKPSEEGLYVDAVAAYDWLTRRGFEADQIVSYGESLGGAMAIELALRRDVGALVTESAFTSLGDMAAEVYPWLPVRLLARIHFGNLAKIERVDRPYLAIHSPGDELVPVAQGRRLFGRAGEPKRWLETRGRHNAGGFTLDPRFRREVEEFLQQWLPPR